MSRPSKKAVELQQNIVREADQRFEGFASQTKETTQETYREICWRKEELGCTWDQALRDTEVQEKLYQLLMHRQYVAYLAEDLRQKTARLLMMQGELSDFFPSREDYTALVEKKAGGKYMKQIFDEFISHIKPDLVRAESDVS